MTETELPADEEFITEGVEPTPEVVPAVEEESDQAAPDVEKNSPADAPEADFKQTDELPPAQDTSKANEKMPAPERETPVVEFAGFGFSRTANISSTTAKVEIIDLVYA